ncbi:MAG: metallophosphoesterase family protein [Chitinophagaceae bacterium]
MTRIGLLSDTHGYLDDSILEHFQHCDEIWHAGDWGEGDLLEKLAAFKPLRSVYGNIDSLAIRNRFPEVLLFDCEAVKVMIKHIGGYPPKYNTATKKQIKEAQPHIFISGHSHILKIMYDEQLACLHMNPGAAGKQGWHKVRTLIRFTIDGKDISNCEVIELAGR